MRKQCLLVLLMTLWSFAPAQDRASAIPLGKLPAEGALLEEGWKFRAGDNPEWADPELDDSQWQDINPALELPYLPQIREAPVGWLRIRLRGTAACSTNRWRFRCTSPLPQKYI